MSRGPAWASPSKVAGSFERRDQAEQARDLLVDDGIPATAVSVVDRLGRAADSAAGRAPLWWTLLLSAAGASVGLVGGRPGPGNGVERRKAACFA